MLPMAKAVVHSKDDKRTYLIVESKHVKKHSHIFPGKHSKKIVPVKKRKHHSSLKKGDKVNFSLNSKDSSFAHILFLSIPIITTLIGLFISLYLVQELVGTVITIHLFMFLGFSIKSIIGKRWNIFAEIDVKIHHSKKR